MIHDIDLVQMIVRSPVAALDAVGTPVFSEEIDIANARLRFENGCVANVTASRVSLKTERKMRMFRDDAYLSLDLQQKILTVIRKRAGRRARRAAAGADRGAVTGPGRCAAGGDPVVPAAPSAARRAVVVSGRGRLSARCAPP